MKNFLRLKGALSVGFLLLFIADLSLAADLIEPSRTLQGSPAAEGNLSVGSEPPGLNVTLDDKLIGKTPIFLDNVKSGIHQLQVKDSETKIYIEPGATFQISLFRGEFVKIPSAEKEPSEQQALKENKAAETHNIQPSPEKEPKNNLTDWEKFTNGSLNHF
jgi:hypothetical protein